MKIKYSKNKKIFIGVFISFVIIIFLVLVFNNLKNDGMQQAGIFNVYYRTYTNEDGWSRWSKNGMTSGNIKKSYNIKNIEFKIGMFSKGSFSYTVYNKKNGWLSRLSNSQKMKNQNFSAIRFSPDTKIDKKYQICYRTYNKKDKWLEWTCGKDAISGNKNENISGIQIKIIPKDVIKNEYLKDYDNNLNLDPFKNF